MYTAFVTGMGYGLWGTDVVDVSCNVVSFLAACSNLLSHTLSSLVSPGESVFFLALAPDGHSGVGKLSGWVKRPLNSSLGEGVVVG